MELTDFRNCARASLTLGPGLTALVGPNGAGKTNILEAVAFVAGLGSIRGAPVPDAALVKQGADSAVIRCRARSDGGRDVLVEAEINQTGRNRLQVNRRRVARHRDLVSAITTTIFSPDDLQLVKGGPDRRRRWLDDAVEACQPRAGAAVGQIKRILRQRNALLRQVGGHGARRFDADAAMTLDVWDSRLAAAGDEIRSRREGLLRALGPRLSSDYRRVAGRPAALSAGYSSSWGAEPLAEALAEARGADLRRGVSTVGPHRDDVTLEIDGRPARTHASQGEQRSLALALRLAVDAEIRRQRGENPVLLLDDVFSELDGARSDALVRVLPEGQCLLTAASGLPEGVRPEQILRVSSGSVASAPPGVR